MHCGLGDRRGRGWVNPRGDGKELGRFMELGSYYVCVWRVVYVGRVGPPSY